MKIEEYISEVKIINRVKELAIDINDLIKDDEVVLIGEQGQEVITVEQVADWANTINYEIITRLRESLPRYYL